VLDNCEHLVDACAELVSHLVRVCPRLRVLVTSRERLAIEGELAWRVAPLDVPDLRQPLTPQQITQIASVRLFIERAHAVDHLLTVSEANAATLARICSAVAGIPLALELAAARVRVLTVEQLADRLTQDAGALGSNCRVCLARHRTIRATIDWSHDLLCEQEQILLRRLSVFTGGWSLSAAEQVCSSAGVEPWEVLDLLTQLVDKSMVLVDTRRAVARYRLLEPIRQCALERLEAAGEASAYRARHAAAFLEVARMCDMVDPGADEVAALDRFELEHDNLRVALRWAVAQQRGDEALRAAAALCLFWERRGHFQEGCAWLEEALALDAGTGPGRYHALALSALAGLSWRGGDLARAQPIAE
jgi:predicted ATPase